MTVGETTKTSIRVATLTASSSRCAGGVFHSVRQLNHAVCQCGVDVHVFSLRDKFTDIDRSAWNGAGLTVCDVRGPQAFGFSPDLKHRLLRWSTDLVHLHGLWMYPSCVSLQWNHLRHKPLMISPQGMLDPWALKNSAWKKMIAGWLYEDRNLRSAACIHALCESEYQSIRAYGLKNPVCIIPNGVDLPEDDPKLVAPWRDAIKPDRKVMLFLGRIHPKKGLSNLVEAWSRVKPKEWILVIAGWDQRGYENQLKKLVVESGLIEEVIFLGSVFEDMKKACLQNADAFILPSYSEGLPISILEAWSYSLPVIMSAQCNIPQGFAGGAAVEVRPEVDSIAEGLKSFFSFSAPECRAMGLRGRNLVETRFSWPQIADQMVSVYQWILGQGPRPDCVKLD